MADIIKKVKIMQPGGTFTDYIPLGADASDVKTEDGMSVEDKLNKKPYHFNTVAEMQSASYLKEGDIAIVLGYENANDGGWQIYNIQPSSTTTDGFVLNSGLKANRMKEKKNLSINPKFSSNEIIQGLNIVNASTGSGSGAASFSGQENVTLMHSNIEGGYWSAKIGNENDTSDTVGIKLIDNTLTSPHGMSLRQRSGQTNGGEHTLFLNKLNNTANNPGIESWAKETQILFNRVKNISGNVGGTGGITMGGKNAQMCVGNYVENFAYGIEIGNSKLNIVSNCFVKNCSTGIICSSSPTQDIVIDNCIVIVPEDGRGIEFANNSAHRIKVSNCIFMYGETIGDYNNTNSRKGIGIYSTSGGSEITFDNCTFANFRQIQCYSGAKFTNCNFINNTVTYINGSVSFVNCIFKDVDGLSIISNTDGVYPSFTGCLFRRSLDNTSMQEYVVGNYNAASVRAIARFTNCCAINCKYNTQVSDTTAGGRNIRLKCDIIDDIFYTYNMSSLSALKESLLLNGYSMPYGATWVDTYNDQVAQNLSKKGHQIVYRASVPTAGAFIKGDRVYNTMVSNSTIDYWVCTKTGEFGTETEPVFLAVNLPSPSSI